MVKTDLFELKNLIESRSPADSNIHLSLVKGGDGLYRLHFDLRSLHEQWEWDGTNSNEEYLVMEFKEYFFSKIKDWHIRRF